MLQAFQGNDKTTYYVLFVAFACLVAIAILLQSKLKLGIAG